MEERTLNEQAGVGHKRKITVLAVAFLVRLVAGL